MNTYTQESFQKYERKSARGAHSSKRKCADQYDTGGYTTKYKSNYREQRRIKRNTEWGNSDGSK